MNTIKAESHCYHCQNRELDLQLGLICGIKKGKRTFGQKCMDFQFRDDRKRLERDFQAELYAPENDKTNIIGTLLKWTIICLCLMGTRLYLWQLAWDSGIMHFLPFAMMLIGLITLPIGIGAYIKGMRSRNYVLQRLEEYDHIYKTYGEKEGFPRLAKGKARRHL